MELKFLYVIAVVSCCTGSIFAANERVLAGGTNTVHFGFTAAFDSISEDIDDFKNQVEVMMSRTEALGADDILDVAVSSTRAGQIGCTATVATSDHAAALTTAIEGKHLSVYINRVGYIAVLLHEDVTTKPTVGFTTTDTVLPSMFNVSVIFDADPGDVDLAEFATEINTSLVVSGVATPSDIITVDIVPYMTNTYALITVKTLEAVSAIETATIDGKFRVALHSRTYTARLSSMPQPTTTKEVPTTVSTRLRKTTEHPSVNGFVWLNEFTSDNEDINDCSTGHDWSGVVVSKMPVGCHRFIHEQTHQDEFNFLELDPDTGNITRFGMICDIGCTSCINNADPSTQFNDCQTTWGGSVSINENDKHCLGAAYLDHSNETVSILQYTTSSCNFDEDPSTVLYVRNYPPPLENDQCKADGSTGTFYMLNKKQTQKGLVFSGRLGCTDNECNDDCTIVEEWEEGSCHLSSKGNGLALWNSNNILQDCSGYNVQRDDEQSHESNELLAVAELTASSNERPGSQTPRSPHTATLPKNIEQMSVDYVPDDPSKHAAKSNTRIQYNSNDVESLSQMPPQVKSNNSVMLHRSSNSEDPVGFNRTVEALLIAGAGGLGLAFVIIGLLYKRNKLNKPIAHDEVDIMKDFRQYVESDGYGEYHDDRLITDI